MADKCCFNINPIVAPACKSSRLKDACVHLKTIYFLVLQDMYCRCYRTCTVDATGHVLSMLQEHVLSMLQDMYCQCYRTCTVNAVHFDETPFMWWCEKEDKKA